jgi:hypothetical protein
MKAHFSSLCKGIGGRKGESVSDKRRSMGAAEITSSNIRFLVSDVSAK